MHTPSQRRAASFGYLGCDLPLAKCDWGILGAGRLVRLSSMLIEMSSQVLISMGLRPIRDPFTWQEVLRDRLLKMYSHRAGGRSTTDSNERTLSFSEGHVYWYLMYVDSDYREGLILSRVRGTGATPSVSPFDTGGVASGSISMPPPNTSAESFVAALTYDWDDGTKRFLEWLDEAYGRPGEYWQLDPVIRPATTPVDISACADPKAWAWEGRMPMSVANPACAIRHENLVMTSDSYKYFQDWLPVNPGTATTRQILELGDWMKRSAIVAPDCREASVAVFDAEAAAWGIPR